MHVSDKPNHKVSILNGNNNCDGSSDDNQDGLRLEIDCFCDTYSDSTSDTDIDNFIEKLLKQKEIEEEAEKEAKDKYEWLRDRIQWWLNYIKESEYQRKKLLERMMKELDVIIKNNESIIME